MELDENTIGSNNGGETCQKSSDVFIDSLESISSEELGPKREDPNKAKRTIFGVVRICLMGIFGTVFVVSMLTVLNSYRGYKQGNDIYSPISENVFDSFLGGERAVSLSPQLKRSPSMPDYISGLNAAPEVPDRVETVENSLRFEIMRSNLNYLKAKNPDVYGYINVEGTKISYPVVRGADNDYYLNRAWNKEYVVVGSIFADCRADLVITENRNTVFYGHNMNDGSMFNNVMNFLDPEVFADKLIEVYTLDGIYIYQPFAVYKTLHTDYYYRMDFLDDEDFVAFCEEARAKSQVANDISVNADDTIITLSTCTPDDDVEYAFRGRYALHAKLIKVEH